MVISNANLLEQIENGKSTDKIIEIKSVYKNGKTTVQPVRDSLSGLYLGVERLSEDDKKHKKFWAEATSKFILRDGVSLNLDKDSDRITWEWVKHQPCLAMDYEECQTRPEAEFYVHLKNKEAEIRISKREIKHKALSLILDDNPVNYAMKAKLLGVDMDGENQILAIKDFLLDMAEKNPESVIHVYEDKMIMLRILIVQAVKKSKIKIDAMGAYRYGNMYMGMDEDSAVEYLNARENAKVKELLERELNPEYFEDKDTDEGDAPVNLSR